MNTTPNIIAEKPYILRKQAAAFDAERSINAIMAAHSLTYCDVEEILFRINIAVSQMASDERKKAESDYRKQIAEARTAKEEESE